MGAGGRSDPAQTTGSKRSLTTRGNLLHTDKAVVAINTQTETAMNALVSEKGAQTAGRETQAPAALGQNDNAVR